MVVTYDGGAQRTTVYTIEDRSFVRGRQDGTTIAVPQGFIVVVGANGTAGRPIPWRWEEPEGPWTRSRSPG